MRRTITTAGFGIVLALAVLASGACSNPEQEKQAYFENANRFLEQKKYAEAIVEYRNALRVDGKFGQARFKLGEAYEATGNASAAYAEFVRAADLMPENVDAQLKSAQFLLLAGQFLDAKTRAERVLERNKTNVEAQVIVGNALAGLKDLTGAVSQMEEAIKLEPGRSQTYANLAMLRMAQGDRNQAEEAFNRAVELDPKSILAWLALANFQFSTNQPAEAERSLKRALAVEGSNVLANRALAALYASTDRTAEAEGPLKTLAETNADPTFKLGLADYYLAVNRPADARAVLDPLVKVPKLAAQAGARLAAITYSTDKPAAHKSLDAVMKQYPKDLEPLILKARWLVAELRYTEALQFGQAATKLEPKSAPAHYLVGLAQVGLRQTVEATASLNEVIRLNPRASAAQLLVSRLHLAAGETDTAVTMAEGAVASAPDSADARAALARSLIAAGNLDRATTEIANLLKAFPQSGMVHALDGAIRMRKKDLAGARKSYDTALQLMPTAFEALAGLTRVDLAENRVAQAKQRVEARLQADPKNGEVMYLAAGIYAAERNLPKAEQTLRKLIEVDPNYSPSYSMLAGLLLAEKKLDAAVVEFDRMATRDPKNVGAMTMAAMIVHGSNVGEAKKRYAQILKDNPGAAVAANNLAWIYADEGSNLDEALRLAQTASAQIPNNAAVLDTLGWVYYRKSMPDRAVEPFEKSIAAEPENPSYHYHLALALQGIGETPRARASAQRALKLKPDYTEAQRLLASMKG